ncbi:MAG: recombination protein RecR [Campylobacterales bacterium]|nr:recombination protein RecR [Campylobacterales bacterium]
MKHKLEAFDNLVEVLGTLPTVGKKSALRFAYHLILKDTFGAMKLANAIETAVRSLRHCQACGGVSEHEVCDICLDEHRNLQLLCIVESAKDIFVLEENGAYEGGYFVLDALEEETLARLTGLIQMRNVQEVIFALTPGLSSDGIILYVEERLKALNLSFTKIAQGVPTGVSLENVDMLSLSKALESRMKA